MLHQKLPKMNGMPVPFCPFQKTKAKPRVKFYPWHFINFKERKEDTLALLDFSVVWERKSHFLMEIENEICLKCWKPNS